MEYTQILKMKSQLYFNDQLSDMENVRSILKSNIKFTPYKFYTQFLEEVASSYRAGDSSEIAFKLFDNGDENLYDSRYRIDPIVIPLLLSLFEQLSKFHKKKLHLELYNNFATIDVLEFLYKSDFFFISGDNTLPSFPKGRNILEFDNRFFGAFRGNDPRKEHRVRGYSLEDDGLRSLLQKYTGEDKQRDFLISHYTYKVREHFQDLLFDNDFTADLHNIYIDILSELITNAVLHSKSNAYALMFVDRYRTKFSISDNGVGFEESMKTKEATSYYTPNQLRNELIQYPALETVSQQILENLFTIFETLYYSALKDRHGIFDLMINVVLGSHGYFRVHNNNSQIIISSRMMKELKDLAEIRKHIYDIHISFLLGQLDKESWSLELAQKSEQLRYSFVSFYKKAIDKYSHEIKYSSLRFFKVKFRGVHIEVEIPNTISNDSI